MSLKDSLLARAHSKNNPKFIHFFFIFLLIFHGQLQAQEEKEVDKDVLLSCKEQIQTFCQEQIERKKARDVIKCLADNDSKLTVQCRQQLQRFAQAAGQAASRGGGSLAQFGGLTGLTPPIPYMSYEGRLTPDTPQMRDNRLLLSAPVYKKEKQQMLASVSAGHLYMGDQIQLDDGSQIPRNLYRTEVGAIYSYRIEDRRSFGVRGSFGYTGDEIQTNTQSFSLAATYSYPSDSGQWMVMAFMSNNAGTFIPVPGFAYILRSPTFNASLGLPMLSMQWTPVNPWAFSFTALGPQMSLEAAYGAIENYQLFTNINWSQQRYLLSDREEFKDRLTFEEKKLGTGIRTPILTAAFLEAQGGLTFDRKVYTGQGFFDHSGGDARLQADWFVSLSFKFAL